MGDCHDRLIYSATCHLEFLRQSFLINDKRVVAASVKFSRNPIKKKVVIVGQRALTTVDRLRGADDIRSVDRADRLVPQTYSENRDLAGKVSNRIHGVARFVGGAGPRRNHNGLRTFQLNVLPVDLRVGNQTSFQFHAAKVSGDIRHETVLVVDE